MITKVSNIKDGRFTITTESDGVVKKYIIGNSDFWTTHYSKAFGAEVIEYNAQELLKIKDDGHSVLLFLRYLLDIEDVKIAYKIIYMYLENSTSYDVVKLRDDILNIINVNKIN